VLARYLKAQLIVLLCGGLVGPIFLVIYYTSGFGDLVQWMLYVGLLITVADVVIAIGLAAYGAQSSAKTAELERNGVLALAQITGLAETGTRINDRPVVRLDMRITGPGFDFNSQKRAIVDIAKQAVVTKGKLVVLVDPNTGEHQIDWQRSGLIAGVVPAQFFDSEYNRTYDLSGQTGPLMEILQIYKANNLPSSGQVDLRSNPVLRQQIMAVVRRAAEQQAPATAPAQGAGPAPVVTPPQPPIAQRLQELETLRASGALTDQEYNARRAQIISEI
jgi:Short C-terminal domain